MFLLRILDYFQLDIAIDINFFMHYTISNTIYQYIDINILKVLPCTVYIASDIGVILGNPSISISIRICTVILFKHMKLCRWFSFVSMPMFELNTKICGTEILPEFHQLLWGRAYIMSSRAVNENSRKFWQYSEKAPIEQAISTGV